MAALPFHEAATIDVAASRERVFAVVDDPVRVAGHMSKRSWRMGGGRMRVDVDESQGRRVGSRTQLSGRAFGVPIAVRTEVLDREAPTRKTWRTIGAPRLLVIGRYRMSAHIADVAGGSRVTIDIDYVLPGRRRGVLARWLARRYARWCVRTMAHDVAVDFARADPAARARSRKHH